MIPKKLNILGISYKVVLVNLDECDGECDFDNYEIRLSKHLVGEHLKFVLLHEIAHVIVAIRMPYTFKNIKESMDSSDIEHLAMDPLIPALYEVLRDNKRLREFIFS